MSKSFAFVITWLLTIIVIQLAKSEEKRECVFEDCHCEWYINDDEYAPLSVDVSCSENDLIGYLIGFPIINLMSYYPKIEEFQINGHPRLNTIPSNAFYRLTVAAIDLRNNKIETIAEGAFNGTSGVTSLYLDGNMIKEFNENTFKPLFATLKILSLNNNTLGIVNTSSLSAVFRQFVHLEELRLEENRLRKVPNLSENKKLKFLELKGNDISTLDPPFNVSHLLPDSLQFLDLTKNRFTLIKDNWFSHLKNLKNIKLSNNLIAIIGENAFKYGAALKTLDLSGNEMQYIPKYLFLNLPALSHFSLEGQKYALTKIENFAFDKNTSDLMLQEINLKKSNIEIVEPKAFCSYQQARPISVNHLQIQFKQYTSIDPCPFYQIENKATLELTFLKCDRGIELLASKFDLVGDCLNENGYSIPMKNYKSMKTETLASLCSMNPIYNCSNQDKTTSSPLITQNSIPSITTHIRSTTNTPSSHKQIINEPLNASSCIFEDCDCDSTDDTLIIECKNSIYSFPQVSHASSTNKSIDLFKLLTHEDSFREIPDNAFQNLNIRAIDLSNNGIKDISRNAFNNLFGLSILDLSINTIKELHENVFLPIESTLKVMNIGSNELGNMDISKLSNIFKNLSQLQELYLQNNGLKLVPDLSNNKQLNELKLENNHISTLDPSGGVLFLLPESLISIDLQNNDLKSIEENWFTHLKNIKTIDLSRNRITTVNDKAFNNLAYLEELDLSFNDIKQLPSRAFLNLPSIKTVRFSSQKSIKYIGNYAFDKISKTNLFYEQIDLFGNSIEYLKPRAFCSRFYRKSINVASIKLEFAKNATIDACALYQIENRNGSKTKLSLKNLKCDCYISQLGNKFDVEGSCYDNYRLIPINQYVCSVKNVVCDQLC